MESTHNEIILYQPDDTLKLDVRVEDETVWLNRNQIAELFGRDVKTIGKHVANALKEELAGVPVVAKFAITATDGKTYQVEHYNLEMIISIGYRVKSSRGIQFRVWANKVLKEYLLRGYSVNQRLLQHHYTKAHDRFLVIDETVYHIGASLKDLGKKLFAFSRMDVLTGSELINRL
ncbi:MAG: virulence RhuM family protein [Duncaniella sp.]|nr:virulence RhuM family protein [Duncaniella sp.]